MHLAQTQPRVSAFLAQPRLTGERALGGITVVSARCERLTSFVVVDRSPRYAQGGAEAPKPPGTGPGPPPPGGRCPTGQRSVAQVIGYAPEVVA